MSTALVPTDCMDVKLNEVTDSNQKGVGQKKMMQMWHSYMVVLRLKL